MKADNPLLQSLNPSLATGDNRNDLHFRAVKLGDVNLNYRP